MSKQDYYEILGVPRDASEDEIEAAYRKLAVQYHPDRYPDNPAALAYFEELNRAYEMLQNEQMRAAYDDWLCDKVDMQFEGAAQLPPASEISAVRPWERYWARMFDGCLFDILFAIFIVILAMGKVIYIPSIPDASWRIFVLFMYVFVEAWLLSTFGTTPGKWLFNIKIAHQSGKPLSYTQALTRSLMVFWRGLGVGLLALFTMSIAHGRLKQNGITSWDREGGFVISHKKVGIVRVVAATVFFIAYLVVSMAMSHIDINGSSQRSTPEPVATTPSATLPDDPNSSIASQPSVTPENAKQVTPEEAAIAQAEYDQSQAQQRSDRINKLYDAKNYYGVIAESRAGQYMMSEHNVVGLAFYATNQFADAIRVFSESETGFPNEPVIKSNLGDALFSNRQPVEALAKYREALALNPNNPSFKQRIQQAQQAVNNLRRNTQSSRLTEDIKSSSTTRETNPNNFVPYYTLNDLMDAIDKSDQTKVDFLLGKGIEINQLNSAGRTPLIAAIRNDDLNMVKHLLDRGADPNMRGSDGYSPIIRAKTAIKPNAEIIQLLKSVGAFDPFSVPK